MKIMPDIKPVFEEMLKNTSLTIDQIKGRIYAKQMAESKPLYQKNLCAEYSYVGCNCHGWDLGEPCLADCEGSWQFVFFNEAEPPKRQGTQPFWDGVWL